MTALAGLRGARACKIPVSLDGIEPFGAPGLVVTRG